MGASGVSSNGSVRFRHGGKSRAEGEGPDEKKKYTRADIRTITMNEGLRGKVTDIPSEVTENKERGTLECRSGRHAGQRGIYEGKGCALCVKEGQRAAGSLIRVRMTTGRVARGTSSATLNFGESHGNN